MMLDHIGDNARAQRIRDAMYATLREGTTVTGDLGGTATTAEFANAIIARLK
jgi:isocitrate dehydrogenase (NAD+)